MSHIEISGMDDPGNISKARRVLIEETHKATRDAGMMVVAAWRGRLVPNVRGYRTGHYSRSITSDVTPLGEALATGRVVGMVGSNVFYARYLEYGTGLYGPLHHWIYPKPPNKFLRFPAAVGKGTPFTLAGRRRSGRAGAMAQYVYARRVRGIVPRRYGRDAAMIAKPLVQERFRLAGRRTAERLRRNG